MSQLSSLTILQVLPNTQCPNVDLPYLYAEEGQQYNQTAARQEERVPPINLHVCYSCHIHLLSPRPLGSLKVIWIPLGSRYP